MFWYGYGNKIEAPNWALEEFVLFPQCEVIFCDLRPLWAYFKVL